MKKTYVLCPLLLLTVTGRAQVSEATREKPNVVFIYADDIGYGDLSCNGSRTIHTSNVERLAESGIRFTNVHAAAATSTPSRYAMLTGEYAWRRQGTGIADGDAGLIIRPERYTMADMFKDAGYDTGVVGKWHLGLGDKQGTQDWNQVITPGVRDLGFDYSFIMAATGDRVPCVFVHNDMVENLDPSDPIQVSYKHNFPGEPTGKDNPELLRMHPSHGHNQSIINGISRIGYMKGGKKALWKDEKIAETLTEKAVGFLESHQDRPFFLYFATQDAHVPRVPDARFVGKSGMGPRGDCLLQFDWSVGQILDALKRLGLDKNTIVILSSDNGPVVDDGYKDEAVELLGNHKPSGIYRGGKYSLFEAGTRVPCVLSWKGRIKQGQVSDALLCQIDWMASLAEVIGVRLPEGAAPDSEAHWEAWTGKEKEGRNALVVQNAQNNLALLMGKWKYLRPGRGEAYIRSVNIETGNSSDAQLYDLEKDPSETMNLAEKEVGVKARMEELLEEIVDTIPQEMWITKLNYTDSFPSKGPSSRSITLEGAIKTGKDGRADLALGNQFKDALVKQPNFSKICGNTATIRYVNVAGAGTAASTGRAGAGQETSFVFTCAKGGGR